MRKLRSIARVLIARAARKDAPQRPTSAACSGILNPGGFLAYTFIDSNLDLTARGRTRQQPPYYTVTCSISLIQATSSSQITASMIGPRNSPVMPWDKAPPMTPIRITKIGVCKPRPMRNGRRMLSGKLTGIMQALNSKAEVVSSEPNRQLYQVAVSRSRCDASETALFIAEQWSCRARPRWNH
jgi:hypothetical protein